MATVTKLVAAKKLQLYTDGIGASAPFFICNQNVDGEVRERLFLFMATVPIWVVHEHDSPRQNIGSSASKGLATSMVDFITHIAAIAVIAAASIATASAAIAAKRRNDSRVLVPVRVRARSQNR